MHDGLPSDEQDPIHLSDAPHRIAFLSAAVLEVRASLPPSFSLCPSRELVFTNVGDETAGLAGLQAQNSGQK